jgi:ParB family chromosome partitioning protein
MTTTITPAPAVEPGDAKTAAQVLKQHGWKVYQQGDRYTCRHPSGDYLEFFGKDGGLAAAARAIVARPDITPDDLLAALGDTAAAPPALADLLPSSTLPLVDLMTALEAQATGLPRPLGLDTRIPRPAGIPDRFDAPIGLVVAGRYQPRTRFDADELTELAESITEHGIIEPLIVFASEHGKLELIAGERRLRAAGQAGLRFVPVEIRSYTLRQIAEISGLDNIQRANLTPIEEGAYFNRLITELAISEAELARRLGKNRAYVQQRRAIAQAVPEVVQALDQGAITFSQARAIAQAAPGQASAQKQALTRLADLTKNGKRTTETEARAAAEKAVLSKAKSALADLGWTVSEFYAYTVIWAPSEKPRQWTGAEILEVVQAKRRPAGERPKERDGSVVAEAIKALKLRYHIHQEHKPWIGLGTGYNDQPQFYAPAELQDVVAATNDAYAALQARAAGAGWTITSSGERHFTAKSAKGAERSVYGWADLEKTVGEIEAGKVKDTPPPSMKGYTSPKEPCARCKKKVEAGSRKYIESAYYCPDCAAIVERENAEYKALIGRQAAALLTPWLSQAPIDALRLLIRCLGWDALHAVGADTNDSHAIARRLRAASAADLSRGIVASATERYYQSRNSPPCDLPGVPAPATVQPSLIPADDPFADIQAHIVSIEGMDAAALEGEVVAELLDLLDDLETDLEALSDAPDVSDEAFEDLTTRIGAARRTLQQASEVAA